MEREKISKVVIIMGALLFVITSFTNSLYAIQRAEYIFDEEGERFPSPISYTFYKEINGADYKCGSFANPEDIFIDKDGNLFVVDSGNNRILKFDKSANFIKAFGEEEKLNKPAGVFVDEEGNIFIADTGNSRILKLDADGHLLKEYKKPSSLLFEGTYFFPAKVAVDARQYLYVLNRGDPRGLILFDGKGMFRGFFASIYLSFSWDRLLFQLFATKEQKEDKRTHRNPYTYSNIDIDDSGFIYGVSGYSENNQIKKVSPVGVNVYSKKFYGELRTEWVQEITGFHAEVVERKMARIFPCFIDVVVNEFGIISALDATSGKVYQYDQEGNLLAIMGGHGGQKHLFEYPVSIATGEEGALYVLDGRNSNIKIFRPTELTQLIHQAARLYFEGKYYEAENLWKEVAKRNSNFALAHTGLGKAFLKRGHYLEAMEEFKYAKDKEGFSKAFKGYRHLWLKEHFGWVALGILAGIIALILLSKLIPKLLEKYKEKAGSFLKTFGHLFKILIFPRETLEEIREANLFSAFFFVLLCFLVSYLRILLTSFHFSTFDPEKTSFLMESAKLFIPWVTWVFASHGVSIIFDGEGTLRDIFISSALCLSPYILFSVPLSLLSRILVLEQKGYYDFLNYLIYAWVIYLFFSQVKVVHNFPSKKAVGISLLNVSGMVIIWVSAVLIYALSYQVFDLVGQIVREIALRGY